ncbi:MAG: hypothetical protein JKY90_00650 [Gammaproteobacteria bacterium]|nr:hypothetical protein [Gammaproteobacteria bacterium]
MSEMGFAQMVVIASFVNGMDMAMVIVGVVIMSVIQMMNVQLNALRAQQRQRE